MATPPWPRSCSSAWRRRSWRRSRADPKREAEAEALGERQGSPLLRFFRAAYDAFADFLSKRDALLILLFVVLFKLTDTFAGVMTGPFVLAIGFDKASYAAIVKGVGLIASLLGGVAGGLLARALPLSRALLVAGILQAVANFTFSWLASIGVNHAGLAIAISTENFTSAIGTVVFIAYLSALCTSPAHTATQFALLTALASFGRTTLASITGFVAAATGWVAFFALCAAAALPGLALLWLLTQARRFQGDRGERAAGGEPAVVLRRRRWRASKDDGDRFLTLRGVAAAVAIAPAARHPAIGGPATAADSRSPGTSRRPSHSRASPYGHSPSHTASLAASRRRAMPPPMDRRHASRHDRHGRHDRQTRRRERARRAPAHRPPRQTLRISSP